MTLHILFTGLSTVVALLALVLMFAERRTLRRWIAEVNARQARLRVIVEKAAPVSAADFAKLRADVEDCSVRISRLSGRVSRYAQLDQPKEPTAAPVAITKDQLRAVAGLRPKVKPDVE
jgi:hypothetical protein